MHGLNSKAIGANKGELALVYFAEIVAKCPGILGRCWKLCS